MAATSVVQGAAWKLLQVAGNKSSGRYLVSSGSCLEAAAGSRK